MNIYPKNISFILIPKSTFYNQVQKHGVLSSKLRYFPTPQIRLLKIQKIIKTYPEVSIFTFSFLRRYVTQKR